MAPLDKKIKKFLKNTIRIAPKISDKGELAELRTGLVSQYPQTRKDAIKQTIKQMTLGKDVSTLFPDVLKNIATNDIEQKKLVYLYVMNYAETHPELCILVVNTFVTDAQDPNPLIRCMAIRTMSMVRVDKILEYIETPLRKTLQDDNPYVRKTAVICVAKLFQLNQELCVELGVIEDLKSALGDENPMVIANSIAALTEIYSLDESVIDLPNLIQTNTDKFLSALNECTEWARVTILTALSEYQAADSLEAQNIIDRVTAHLQHVNPAVILATVKVIIRNLPSIDGAKRDLIMRKLSSALISLMSTPPELQYVALKNIRIILEKYPEILSKELRIFYIKFNDPLYVKIEKIEIMIRLVDPSNLKQCTLLLNELKEYAMEFDIEFVSRCILGISQLAIKYADERFIQKVLDILVELLEPGQDAIKDSCCEAMCNILRHCPTNDAMCKQVCSILNSWASPVTSLQKDTAKCNYVWLMGEYPQYFPGLSDKIDQFVENFTQESSLTQVALLISVVKLHSTLSGNTLQTVLELATHDTMEVDVRDMAMIYWRCLSLDDSSALVEQLCNLHAPVINCSIDSFTPEVLERLLGQLGTISSIYFKPMDHSKHKRLQHQNIIRGKHIDELQNLAKNELESKNNDDILLDFDSESVVTNTTGNPQNNNLLGDLDDLFDFGPSTTSNSTPTGDITSGLAQTTLNDTTSTSKPSNTTATQDLVDLF